MRVTGLTPQDLKAYGIHDVQEIVYNPDYDTLYQEELNPALEGYERGIFHAPAKSPRSTINIALVSPHPGQGNPVMITIGHRLYKNFLPITK